MLGLLQVECDNTYTFLCITAKYKLTGKELNLSIHYTTFNYLGMFQCVFLSYSYLSFCLPGDGTGS